MSFGFSIGDFLHLAELIQKTRKSFVYAPHQFRSISDEVKTLATILQDLEDVVPERELSPELSESLTEHVKTCNKLLEDLQSVLKKYYSLDSNDANKIPRIWKRLKWEPDDIKDLRLRLSVNISLLNTISDQLSRVWLSTIEAGVSRLNVIHRDENFVHVTFWISSIDIAAQHNDIITRRHRDTGRWFLASHEYLNWLESENGTLFCPGLPGGGKTMIAATVVEDLWSKFDTDPSVAIAFIYLNYKRKLEQTLEGCLASLLKQFVQRLNEVPNSIQKLYDTHKIRATTKLTADELVTLLRSIMGRFSQVYLVVDALDEYSDYMGSATSLLRELSRLQTGSCVATLATSRPNIPGIKAFFDGKTRLEISANEEDVKLVIRHAMPGMPTCISNSEDLQELIVDEITKAVKGMFLLTRLFLDSLRDKLRRKQVLEALKILPRGEQALTAAYTGAIERIDAQRPGCRDLAKLVLAWVSHARRPLTRQELRYALAVEIGETTIDESNLPELEEMVSFCEGLVVVDAESDIIGLVHYTTQEYLEQTKSRWLPNAHRDIGLACLSYLSFDEFSTGRCRDDKAFEDRLQRHVLLDYSAKNWGDHVRAAYDAETDDAALTFLRDGQRVTSAVQVHMVSDYRSPGYSVQVPGNMGALHIAALFGMNRIISRLLVDGGQADEKDDFGKTPLSYAAEYGRADSVQFLVQRSDVLPDSTDNQKRSPLSWAAANNHVDVLQRLLDHPKVHVNSRDARKMTPLAWAARMGSLAAVKWLLQQYGIDKESRDRTGQTPLSWAAYNGHLEVVRTLVESPGVDADSRDDFSLTPMSWAARNGHVDVVAYLLSLDQVNVDSRDEDDRTALTWASMHGHVAAVVALVSCDGVNCDLKDKQGQTPLSWAAREGHRDVVEFLVARPEVHINSVDRKGLTPRRWAEWNGYEDVAKFLESVWVRRNSGSKMPIGSI